MDESLQKVFAEQKPTVILFLISGGRVLNTYRKVTKEFPQLNVVYANIGNSISSKANEYMMDILGITKNEAPVLVLLPFKNTNNGITPKYKTKKLSESNIRNFIEQGLKEELEIYMKSETIQKNLQIEKYTRISLNNFQENVIEKDKHFLLGLEFFQEFTPKNIKSDFRKIAEAIEALEMQEEIEVGICDLYKNELLHLIQIETLPFIVLYKKGEKDKFIAYKGKRKERLIREWLEEQTGIELGSYKKGAGRSAQDLQDKMANLQLGDGDL